MVGVGSQSEHDNNIPPPNPQLPYVYAKDHSLLMDPLFKDIKFNVLNIKHFYKNGPGLLSYVKSFKPSAIIIDWHCSQDNDVANLLHKSGTLAEIWVQYERTSVVGMNNTKWVDLDKRQTTFLRTVAKGFQEEFLRHVVLIYI